MNEKYSFHVANLLLRILIIVAISVIGIIVWKGFGRLQEQIFGIKVVLADMNYYLQHGE